MPNRLQTLWECFTAWDVEPTSLEEVQVIIPLPFGGHCESTRIVAEETVKLYERLGVPLYTESYVDSYIPSRIPRLNTNQMGDTDVDGFLEQAAEDLFPQGIKVAALVTHGDHRWRSLRNAVRNGFDARIPAIDHIPYDKKSVQKQMHFRFLFMSYEILARLLYFQQGKV